jgi:hypothetical protein
MNAETSRLEFIKNRDGLDAAIDFAKRTLVAYRKAVLCSRKRGVATPHHASLPEYRRTFIESYCAFKSFLEENKGL